MAVTTVPPDPGPPSGGLPHEHHGLEHEAAELVGAGHLASHLNALREQITRLEQVVEHHEAASTAFGVARHRPSWLKPTQGEHRIPVVAAVAVAIVLQLALPSRLSIHPTWLLPTLEGALGLGLTIANPRRINRTSTALRTASVSLIVAVSASNAWSSVELVKGIIDGVKADANAGSLLGSGASIYLTNVIVFALWYWEWDRGGPYARSQALRPHPDFLFANMTAPELSRPDWAPTFVDYLYLSFTNATAFSPTDTLPLSRWAKLLMLLQSGVALITVALVVSRAVNIFQ
jgi:hypothetical protein